MGMPAALARNLRVMGRRILANAWSNVTALACIALGLGSIVSIVRVADSNWFGAPPGVRKPEELSRAVLETRETSDPSFEVYWAATLLDQFDHTLRDHAIVGGMHEQALVVRTASVSERADGALVTSNFFNVLAVAPEFGTSLPQGATEPAVLVSRRFALRHFGAPEQAVGKALSVGKRGCIIVGTLPAGFLGTESRPIDIWLSAEAFANEYLPRDWQTDPTATAFRAFVRRRPGTSKSAVVLAGNALFTNSVGTLSDGMKREVRLWALPPARGEGSVTDAALSTTVLLLGALLWIAVCTNVAGIILVQTINRQGDSAIRLALGAQPRDLSVLWLGEISAIVLLGTIGGLGVARIARGSLISAGLVRAVPTYQGSSLHLTLVVVAVSLMAISLAMWVVVRQNQRVHVSVALNQAVRSVSGANRKTQLLLLCTQVAFSTALIYGAGLFLESYRRANAAPLGFDSSDLYFASGNFSTSGYSLPEVDRIYAMKAEELRHVVGVEAVSVGATIPFEMSFGAYVYRSGKAESVEMSYINIVSPNFFRTTNLALKQGRDFDDAVERVDGAKSVIVSEGLAKALLGSANPLGACLVVMTGPCRTVIGVVTDAQQTDIRTRVTQVYVPLTQMPDFIPSRVLFFRVRPGSATSIENRLDALLNAGTRDVPISWTPMRAVVGRQIRPWRLAAEMLSACSVIAVLILGVGVFGVVAMWVRVRAREVSILLALGAPFRSISVLLVRSLVLSVFFGAVGGLTIGTFAGYLLRDQLFDTGYVHLGALAASLAVPVIAASIALAPALLGLRKVQPAHVLRA